ncbi:hydroxylamine reductase [Myxococcota bacterium]|nr:hydroxylamine reductase [Myxococcota bacterium]MBU1432430.1 hydroxylamine reductase [Myxococcota bacterium]MBU1900442.1 hydroxylamine reductase [Myxococcota bacterium]
MFCFQCQEASKNEACVVRGVCGKTVDIAELQDLLIHTLKGIAVLAEGREVDADLGRFITGMLYTTVTNVNFDAGVIEGYIQQAMARREALAAAWSGDVAHLPDAARWQGDEATYHQKAHEIGLAQIEDKDTRSLRELLVYGLKGMAAYAEEAAALGHVDETIWAFIIEALASTTRDLSVAEMINYVMRAGEVSVTTMALLDAAHTATFGAPEITEIKTGVGARPGILISGHSLGDLKALLDQTAGAGVDVYTHSEMLPAHAYPLFKGYPHLVGNYGNAWWQQDKEFAAFNGPILMTTNCITPPKADYAHRIYTTNQVGFEGIPHIPEGADGHKDFSALIEQAKACPPPTALEDGAIIGGFAHRQVLQLADKVIDAVKSGAIKRFVVMAGCDGRHKGRDYYTQVAQTLPQEAVILTAGCAKYRYNKLELGDIGGIPRVLDAGQCNDSYSLAVVALKLKEAFGLDDINDLPISYDIAWYEQKAVTVLLALLHLGVKGIRLGPTLPAFLSPNVAKVLVESFGITPIGEVAADVAAIMEGR